MLKNIKASLQDARNALDRLLSNEATEKTRGRVLICDYKETVNH
jgi:hypothetical protein